MSSYLLVPEAVFRTPHGFVRDIRCHCLALHCQRNSHDLDICVLHMLVEVLHHSPLHMLVEGWLRTLLVVLPSASRAVPHTLGRLVRTQPAMVLLGKVDVLAMPLASLGLVVVVLGGR